MNGHPNALELLRIANHTLTQEILPDAKPEQLYTLRMIANALGITARELESRDADMASESRSLAALYENTAQTESLQQLNQALARDIRGGKFEQSAEQEMQLRQHLLSVARAKLAITYPRALSENNIK
jgi:hypothetical protein